MPSCCICKKKRLLGEVILSPRFRWLPGSSRLVIGAHQSTQTLRNFKESVKSAKSKLLVPALAVVLKRQEGHEWLLLRNPRALQWRCSPARTIGVKTNRISPVLVPSNAQDQKRIQISAHTETSRPVFCILLFGVSHRASRLQISLFYYSVNPTKIFSAHNCYQFQDTCWLWHKVANEYYANCKS